MRGGTAVVLVSLFPWAGLSGQAELGPDTARAAVGADSLSAPDTLVERTADDISEVTIFSALVGGMASLLTAGFLARGLGIDGDFGPLLAIVVAGPGVVAAAATAGGVLYDDRDAPAIHRFGAALGGAYMPLIASLYVAEAFEGDELLPFLVFAATPLFSSAAAVRLPRGDWRTTIAFDGMWAPVTRDVCESCGSFAANERLEPERIQPHWSPSVGISRTVTENLWVGAAASGFYVQEGFDQLSGAGIRWRGQHIATALLATAEVRARRFGSWALLVGGGLGGTTYHEYLGPAFTGSVSLTRPVSPTDRAGFRVGAAWFDGVPVLTIGARLDSSS